MPRDPQTLIFVGIRGGVVALVDGTGAEVWRAKLKGTDFVTVLWDGASLVAATAGEVFGLDPRTGGLLWTNGLEGMGRGLVSLASSRAPAQGAPEIAGAARKRQQEQAAAGAAVG